MLLADGSIPHFCSCTISWKARHVPLGNVLPKVFKPFKPVHCLEVGESWAVPPSYLHEVSFAAKTLSPFALANIHKQLTFPVFSQLSPTGGSAWQFIHKQTFLVVQKIVTMLMNYFSVLSKTGWQCTHSLGIACANANYSVMCALLHHQHSKKDFKV